MKIIPFISLFIYISILNSIYGQSITTNLSTSQAYYYLSALHTMPIQTKSIDQSTANTSYLRVDLEAYYSTDLTRAVDAACECDTAHISCFTSVLPGEKDQNLYIPSSHDFQVLFKEGDTYTGGGTAGGSFDFTGFVPYSMTSSKKGYLSVNHETNPGGVSILNIHLNEANETWIIDTSKAVNFSNVVKTERNCSGGVTPWGTVMTCEETTASGDANSDNYQDVGWIVEIDPRTKKVKEYGNNKEEKLWAMGRMSHENVALKQDSLTAYYGEDEVDGSIYKFVANSKTNFYSGTLYALKLNSGIVANEPTTSVGIWIMVPNSTAADRNNAKVSAKGLGATLFNGVEDVEISPRDGKIYFTAKGNARVYRFADNGSTVSDFETFLGGKQYKINYGNGVAYEDWGIGNDNLTFDDKGNLYVLQDGKRDHVWMAKYEHTQAAPKVELFMKTPKGSEPTGMTFTPDYKYMFISIQHPSALNTIAQQDIKGTSVVFNKSYTLVVARKSNLDGIVQAAAPIITIIGGNTLTADGSSMNINTVLTANATLPQSTMTVSGSQSDKDSTFTFYDRAFANPAKVKILNLREKKLDAVPTGISKFPNMAVFSIMKNNVTSLSDELYHAVSLRELIIRNNQICAIDDEINKLNNLEIFTANNNKISKLPNTFASLSKLKVAHLHSNQIAALPENIGQMQNLKTLCLQKNKLAFLPQSIGNMKGLTFIDLSDNKFTQFPMPCVSITGINHINLSNNKLKTLPDEISKLVNLKELIIIGNQIEALPETFENLKSLEILIISDNKLTQFPQNLSKLKKLKTLIALNNKLSEVEKMRIKKSLPKCDIRL
ncbi:MAG: DUF839 domain-containing protein [Cytophagales bacterium]|nr:DUF839 domain-containing protein [Cytophagales bacterium]